MGHATFIRQVRTREARDQVRASEDLWDQMPIRTEAGLWPATPFAGTSDIWLRWGKDPTLWTGPHFAEFWPAWSRLTEVQPLVWQLVEMMTPTALGAVLLTRVPAGGRVAPHCDKGSWHADYMTTKFYTILESPEDCITSFDNEQYIMQEGQVWLFNNLVEHAVRNDGASDRVALITCMRVER